MDFHRILWLHFSWFMVWVVFAVIIMIIKSESGRSWDEMQSAFCIACILYIIRMQIFVHLEWRSMRKIHLNWNIFINKQGKEADKDKSRKNSMKHYNDDEMVQSLGIAHTHLLIVTIQKTCDYLWNVSDCNFYGGDWSTGYEFSTKVK